ncbi:hypothetical protein [Candidatus Pelagibacter sp. HIMB1509]|uniref:hypothetical protein n=1 Tax=Candidatus Pelagibacter sp. HIMB1509 TaxID=3413339 RepID=UPI003F84FB49
MKEKLNKLFIKHFSINIKKIENSNIKNTEKWDSFSHINLILEIEEKFKLKKIKPSKIANLTSYKACYKYIITEQSK